VNRLVKPGKRTVALNPPGSRIRRAPVQVQPQTPVVPRKARVRTREEELWLGVAGIVALASACAALIVGVSAITRSDGSASAAEPERFSHCYSGKRQNCVWDGDTANIDGERVEIAGMDAPEVSGSTCPNERRRGIDAAVRLRDLLNSGEVKLLGTQRAHDGRLLTKVEVDGRDVGVAMVAAGVAREYGGGPRSWCD